MWQAEHFIQIMLFGKIPRAPCGAITISCTAVKKFEVSRAITVYATMSHLTSGLEKMVGPSCKLLKTDLCEGLRESV